MPGKWGGVRRARPPLDPPMVTLLPCGRRLRGEEWRVLLRQTYYCSEPLYGRTLASLRGNDT